MLIPSCDVWATRIQSISAILTATDAGRDEAYYLATTCQVGIAPPLISVSPNPEYPVCDAILGAGYFGLSFLSEDQADIVSRCIRLDKLESDKLNALGVSFERNANGTPLLLECIQSVECKLEQFMVTGDHWCGVGTVIARRIRAGHRTKAPHRFGGKMPRWKQLVKSFACRTRLYDVVAVVQGAWSRPLNIEQGTRLHIPGSPSASPQGSKLEGSQPGRLMP